MRIALISDTHLPSLIRTPDELGPALGEFLATAELILHGGDVVRPSVLDWCEQFAPVVVAQGNNDAFEAYVRQGQERQPRRGSGDAADDNSQ